MADVNKRQTVQIPVFGSVWYECDCLTRSITLNSGEIIQKKNKFKKWVGSN